MKKFIKYLLPLLIIAGFTASLQAQTYVERNITEKIKRYVTTPSNTQTKVDSITLANNEAGIIQVKVVGMSSSGSDPITGTLQYSYTKASGTLALGTSRIVDTVRVDSDISGATFAASASNDNIKITVTGKSGVPIRWTVITKQWARRND
jgi:hypothetical protein